MNLLYDFGLTWQDSKLVGTVNEVNVNPQLKSVSEGFLSGALLTGQGADLIAGAGMDRL